VKQEIQIRQIDDGSIIAVHEPRSSNLDHGATFPFRASRSTRSITVTSKRAGVIDDSIIRDQLSKSKTNFQLENCKQRTRNNWTYICRE